MVRGLHSKLSSGPIGPFPHLGSGGVPSKDIGDAGPVLGGRPVLGSFKTGGNVSKTGLYQLEKGEKVVPVGKKEGRDSEYRRVYANRKKKKDGKGQ